MSDIDPGFPGRPTVAALTAALRVYREARKLLVATLNLPMSNRDPLAKWAENLVAAVTGGTLEESRVHPEYDLTTPEKETVQVRYLANTSQTWVNEHRLTTKPGVWWYALVLIEDFTPTARRHGPGLKVGQSAADPIDIPHDPIHGGLAEPGHHPAPGLVGR